MSRKGINTRKRWKGKDAVSGTAITHEEALRKAKAQLRAQRETIRGRYTKEETAKLKHLYEHGYSIDSICRILKRKRKSILNKIYHMGLKRKIELKL